MQLNGRWNYRCRTVEHCRIEKVYKIVLMRIASYVTTDPTTNGVDGDTGTPCKLMDLLYSVVEKRMESKLGSTVDIFTSLTT
jgi:hypothetical protein